MNALLKRQHFTISRDSEYFARGELERRPDRCLRQALRAEQARIHRAALASLKHHLERLT